jgi:hypothetical protein
MTLIVSILILAYLIARLRPGAHPMAANAGKNRKASLAVPGETGTVVQWVPEPPNWSIYTRPTFLRRKGPEAQRVRDDLAEFRKDIDGDVEDDWIARLIRRQIAAAA